MKDYIINYNHFYEKTRKVINAGLGVALTLGAFSMSNYIVTDCLVKSGYKKQTIESSLQDSQSTAERIIKSLCVLGKPGRDLAYYLNERK